MARKGRRVRHVPQRTCVICREKQAKRQLTRIVNTPESGVLIDLTGKRNGRGAYLCSKAECWEAAITGQALEAALRTTLSPTERLALEAIYARRIASAGGAD